MKEFEFKKLGKRVNMLKTSGGHYVIPLVVKKEPSIVDSFENFDNIANREKNVNDDLTDNDKQHEVHDNDNNVKDIEADAVMLVLLADCKDDKDLWKLNDIMGHSNFITMMLDDGESKEIEKVHRYFGHKSGRKV